MADIQVCAGNLSDAVEPRIDKDPLVGDSEDASKDDLHARRIVHAPKSACSRASTSFSVRQWWYLQMRHLQTPHQKDERELSAHDYTHRPDLPAP
eukprot:461142-Pelagomonas_calceolata.AAC.1